MIDEAELREMSVEERARLARTLAAMNARTLAPTPISLRRRRLLIAASLAGALILAVWIGILEVKLPRHYRAGGWKAAWVGFDIGLLVVFVTTSWAAWRRRQILIICLMVLATLLCCDAWFDTTLDYGTKGFTISVLSAAVIELPIAAIALIGARRLLRLTIGRLELMEGGSGRGPSFWRMPLFGDHAGSYRALLHNPSELVSKQTKEAKDLVGAEAKNPRAVREGAGARGVTGETCS